MPGQRIKYVLEDIDPRELLVDANVREASVDVEFVGTIREWGILQPPVAVRTPGGSYRVRLGHRRVLGGIEAGEPSIQVLVIIPGPDDTEADITRIITQVIENQHRAGLTAAEEVGAIAELLDFGMPAGELRRRTGRPAPVIAAAKVVRASPAAMEAARVHQGLDILQLSALADFEDDPETREKLAGAGAQGDGPFRLALQKAKDDRADREALDQVRAELAAAGVTILTAGISYDYDLDYLAGPDGAKLTPETHRSCPGRAARVYSGYRRVSVTHYCTDPRAHGHRKLRSGGGSGAQQDAGERSRTVALNRDWRTAETVRRQWLRDLLARKRAPEGGLRFVIESLAMADGPLHRSLQRGHETARELLGLPEAGRWGPDRVTAVVELVSEAGDSRALVIALGLVLGAYEGSTDVQLWKSPASHSDIARYFEVLARWGHHLSDIERAIVEGRPPA
jgi:ParB family chromosome partitioning protein